MKLSLIHAVVLYVVIVQIHTIKKKYCCLSFFFNIRIWCYISLGAKMVINSWMEVTASPAAAGYISSTKWILGEKKSGKWSEQENKIFENALAHVDLSTPDRWERVANLLPGKSVRDVISHFKDLEDDISQIEAGLIPVPGYASSSFSFGFDEIKQSYNCGNGKRGRFYDHDRKKGVPWTEEEHKQFLMGLKAHGKGFWRNISRNFVVTRTPTQVASHAQKYYNRLSSVNKDKKRASIHDITIANLSESSGSTSSPSTRVDESNQLIKEEATVYSNGFMQLHNGAYPSRIKLEHPNSYIGGGLHDPMVGHRMMLI